MLVYLLSHPLTKFVGTPINEPPPPPPSVCHSHAPTKAHQSPPVFILLRASASSWADNKGGEDVCLCDVGTTAFSSTVPSWHGGKKLYVHDFLGANVIRHLAGNKEMLAFTLPQVGNSRNSSKLMFLLLTSGKHSYSKIQNINTVHR